MRELESPTFNPDLRDSSNGINIAMVKPGEEIRVIVRVDDSPLAAKLMDAVGSLSNDGKSFSVVMKKEDGTPQTHDISYRDLLKTL